MRYPCAYSHTILSPPHQHATTCVFFDHYGGVCRNTCMLLQMCVLTYIRTDTYTYPYTPTNTHTHTPGSSKLKAAALVVVSICCTGFIKVICHVCTGSHDGHPFITNLGVCLWCLCFQWVWFLASVSWVCVCVCISGVCFLSVCVLLRTCALSVRMALWCACHVDQMGWHRCACMVNSQQQSTLVNTGDQQWQEMVVNNGGQQWSTRRTTMSLPCQRMIVNWP